MLGVKYNWLASWGLEEACANLHPQYRTIAATRPSTFVSHAFVCIYVFVLLLRFARFLINQNTETGQHTGAFTCSISQTINSSSFVHNLEVETFLATHRNLSSLTQDILAQYRTIIIIIGIRTHPSMQVQLK